MTSASLDAPPLYRRIAARVRGDIAAGRLAAGARLPTIRALAAELGVNRDTVALAYDALAREGLVESTVGRGTYVRSAAPAPEPFEPTLAPGVERLLETDRVRARHAAPPGVVPLHSLVPDPSLYPAEEFRRALNRVLSRGGSDLLRYGEPQGHRGLREVWAERLRVAPEALVITQGASEAIALALRLFATAGDAVAVEEPTYHNVLGALVALGVRAAPVPMRDGAPDLAALERVLARPEVKAFYTMPTFHNPLGTCTSLAHRRALLALAAQAKKPVIEDCYEADLRFAGRPVEPLAALDPSGLVVQLFSFSKSLFPGARVGALVARGRALDGAVVLKQATDLGGALAMQGALAEFVRSGGYDRHLGRVRRTLRGRRDALLEALEAEMPEGARWTEPEGGLQLWVELPGGVDTADLLPDAIRNGVLYAPGFQFRHDHRPSQGLRLSLALADAAAIRRGVAILARTVRERLGRGRRVEHDLGVYV